MIFSIFLLFFHFSLDEACFGVDLERCTCAMDMADGALEMLDVMLFSRGMGALLVACFVANGPSFVTRPGCLSQHCLFFSALSLFV